MNTLYLGYDLHSKILLDLLIEGGLAFVKVKYSKDHTYPRLICGDTTYEGQMEIPAKIESLMPMLYVTMENHKFTNESKQVIDWISSNKLNKLIRRKQGDQVKIEYDGKEFVGFDQIKKKFANLKNELIKINEPSFLEKIKTLKDAAVNELEHWSETLKIQAKDETVEHRKSICWGSEHCMFMKDDGHCSKCGCNMKIKTTWRGQFCPIGKWGVEE